MKTTNPGTTYNSLRGDSCVSTSFCVAAGYYAGDGVGAQTLAELWDGSSWSTMTTTNPGTGRHFLRGVSCMSPSFCVAAGYYSVGSGWQTLAENYGNPLGLSI